MFLKSVELFGFKSFAEKSLIEFTDGVSALLGPNGCGKSNVVDAIKWALGEQATRSLRADRMEDVIFNGTESRKALGVAEVTLTLVNDGNVLPLDVGEIAIKRRLYRSGESEYLLNGTPVKLKEVRELLFDTGIGKTAYSIMEQGRIDQILSNKPDERRIIFEEAASITKYRVKGQEAERKLERTEENMRQVEGILGEVKRSHDALKGQAEKTLRHRALRDTAFDLERDVHLLRLKAYLESKDQKGKVLEARGAKRDEIKRAIDLINESLESNLDFVNEMESRLIENQKKLYGVELERNNLESQERMILERVAEAEAKLAADHARESKTSERARVLEADIQLRNANLADFRTRVADVERNIAEFERDIEIAAGRVTENNHAVARLQAGIVELEAATSRLRVEQRDLTDSIVAELDRRLRESGYTLAEHRRLESELEAALEGLRIALEIGFIGVDPSPSGGSLTEVRERTASVRRTFESFRRLFPSFLDEFVSPQGIITKKRDLDSRMESNEISIGTARAEVARIRTETSALETKASGYRSTLEELRLNRVRMQAQMTGAEEALGMVNREKTEQERSLLDARKEIDAGLRRVEAFIAQRSELEERRVALSDQAAVIRKDQVILETSISDRNKDLVEKERRLKTLMGDLGRSQTELEKTQMEVAEIGAEVRNIYDNFRERFSRDLRDFEPRIFEITESVKDLRDRLSEAREEQRRLGQVNLMAPEEFAEVKERFEFLKGQLDDLKKAREDLRRITDEIRVETATLFLGTYEKIRKNFHTMFRRLFGGGRAELKLTDPNQVLESGIEILVQPPGKKLENIALLSGGERSLTAVALLFATYMVKPSPFCLLDEIDAALDENNVGRFIGMLSEFAANSQFVIVTHNKRTVAGAKTLIGVTMEESGVSKVVAIRLDGVTAKEEALEPV